MTKLFVTGALLAAVCGGQPPPPGEYDPRDVTGNYDVRYDNNLKLQLNIGGAVREVTQTGYGGVTDFGVINGQPVTIRLQDFCDRPEVKCPSELFWAKVAIDQPHLQDNNFDLQELRVVDDTVHMPPVGQKAGSFSGLVDHGNSDRYIAGLGIQGAASGACAAFDVSFTGGRFGRSGETVKTTMEYRDERGRPCDPDAGTPMDAGTSADGGTPPPPKCTQQSITSITYPPKAAVSGIKDGKVGMFWAGGCAFGPILVGATLYLETGYTASRTGDFDPPPFTPAPVVLPDGGTDGGQADGG